MTPKESLAKDAYQMHKHSPNLCYSQPQVRGDIKKALATSAVTVEGDYSTQMNHQRLWSLKCAWPIGKERARMKRWY